MKRAAQHLKSSKQWIPALKNTQGSSVSNREIIVETASNFYQELYDCKTTNPQYQNHGINQSQTNEGLPPLFIESEIGEAIKSLKLSKSPGEDGITNDILKALIEPLTPPITDLFNKIIRNQVVPKDWDTAIISLLYKKGDPADIQNYRPISLLQTFYKLFTNVITRRITSILDSNQPREQAGFRAKYSTMDHIFVLTQVIEKYVEYGKELYIAFVDYKKAFDCIEHEGLWISLQEQGVEQSFITILQQIYKNSKAIVKLERKGKPFDVKRGVRQGDPISPKLFTALLEKIFKNLEWDQMGININGEYLNHLRFADDIVILSNNHEDLQYMITSLERESKIYGLEMNLEKTCVMSNGPTIPVSIGSNTLQYVDNYVYLGQNITFSNPTATEVERRIKKAWGRYWSLKYIFKSSLPMNLKKKAMDSIILPTLLYGCQTWPFSVETLMKLRRFQRATERSILGLRLKDKVNSKIIRQKTKLIDVVKMACSLKWKWAGHVSRASDGRWSERVLHWYPREARRPRGRPRRRWRDDIVQVAGPLWTRITKDRQKWMEMEEAFTQKWVPNV